MITKRAEEKERKRVDSIVKKLKGTPEENRKKLDSIVKSAWKNVECFGAAIRKRREMLGLKVYEVAYKVGVNPVYITQIERHGKLPSPFIMQKIMDAIYLPSDVFKIYLKMKYPALYEKVESNDAFIFSEFEKKVEKLMFKKNRTPEEEEILERESSNLNAMREESRAKIKKSIELLEKIEKLNLDLKNSFERRSKPKKWVSPF